MTGAPAADHGRGCGPAIQQTGYREEDLLENRHAKTCLRAALLASAALALTAGGASAQDDLTIGYVTKSATNQGWILINAGAADAAAAAGAEFIEIGPASAGDLQQQLAAIEDMLVRGVDALAVAPVDSAGVAPAVRDALSEGVPVIAVDTAVDGAEVTSFVATDNVAAAASQGKWVAENIEENGEVILVNGLVAQSTGRERRDGFLETLAELRPDVTVYQVDTQWDQSQAQNGVEDLLLAHPGVDVIANAWDGGSLGAIAALQAQGFGPGDIKVVGFDGDPNGLKAIRDGWMQADVAQMLYMQGYKGIEAAIAAARGEPVEPRIDTGHFVVLPENVDQFIVDNKLDQFMQ